jgi:hypothetical protein
MVDLRWEDEQIRDNRPLWMALLMLAMVAASEDNGSQRQDASKAIKLPQPRTDGGISVEKALLERRSIRSFRDQALTL